MNVLAVDVGGTHVKFRTQRHQDPIHFTSGARMTPQRMVKTLLGLAPDLKFDHVSIGYPGPVIHDRPLREPFNLGKGWRAFDYVKAFGGKPVRLINDAAMQALGSYKGGRMLFLGLGTGLGAAMIVEGEVQAMELAHLPWKKGRTYEEYLGLAGLERLGKKKWNKQVHNAVAMLSYVLQSEYVVLGGGNAKLVEELPPKTSLGDNSNAFLGGFALWKKSSARKV